MSKSLFLILVALIGAAALNLKANPQVSGKVKPHSQKAAKKRSSSPEVNQSIIVCNAYAYKEPLDVERLRDNLRITEKPIAYKQCQDLIVEIKNGDRLDFKAGNNGVGKFYATGLPTTTATMLLVPHRRSNHSMAVDFESHTFADLKTTQVAVVDAYGGSKNGILQIMDEEQAASLAKAKLKPDFAATQKDANQRVEELRFNSVVALNPGKYQVGLAHGVHATDAGIIFQNLAAAGEAKYVIFRVGVDDGSADKSSQPYPEELVIFPQSFGFSARPGLFMFLLGALVSSVHVA